MCDKMMVKVIDDLVADLLEAIELAPNVLPTGNYKKTMARAEIILVLHRLRRASSSLYSIDTGISELICECNRVLLRLTCVHSKAADEKIS